MRNHTTTTTTAAAAAGEAQHGYFKDKVVIITGAGGQLGREGCRYFAARGAKIVALDLSADALEETFESILHDSSSSSGNAYYSFDFKPYVCDVTNAAAVDEVMSHIVSNRFQRIDLLWNNAGYQGQIAPILTLEPQDFANVMNVNVTGMFIVLQAVAKRMVQQGNATTGSCCYAIVNTASVAGLRGTPAMAAYASSKAAVLTLSVTAAKELAVHGIRVNAVSPALIGPGTLWERQNALHAKVGPPYFASTAEAVAEAKIQQVPMKRLGTAEEVVKTVAFLLSDDASYTTGINMTVDGGMAAGLKA
jgi:NAD(P)-dependent dehydrogenase (short-subunit alcohol dehydrogenase family)